MASDGLGLLGSARLDRFREENADVLTGPTPEEISASRSTAGAGLGLKPVPRGFSGALQHLEAGRILPALGETIRGISMIPVNAVSIAASGQTINEQEAFNQQLRQAALREARTKNLLNAATALNTVSSIAANIGSIRDPSQRAAVATQTRAALGDDVAGMLDVLVENQALARLDTEKRLATVMEMSPTAQAYGMANNFNFTDAPSEVQQRIAIETVNGLTQRELPKSKRSFARLANDFRKRHPERYAELEKTDKALSVAEADEIVAFGLEENEIDPSEANLIRRGYETRPQAFGLKEDDALKKRQELIEKEAIKASFRQPRVEPNAELRNVRLPDGRTMVGRITPSGLMVPTGPGGQLEVAPQGTVMFGTQVTGSSDDVFDPKKNVPEAIDAAARIQSATRALFALQENPGMAGLSGTVAETLGGVVGQVNGALGDLVSEGLTGANLGELQNFRQQARAIVSESVKTLGIEESGRITDMERRLSEQATALTAPTRNTEQVLAGLVALQQLAIVSQERKLMESGAPPKPLGTREADIAELNRYMDLGMNEAQASDTLNHVKAMQKEIKQVLDRVRQGDE